MRGGCLGRVMRRKRVRCAAALLSGFFPGPSQAALDIVGGQPESAWPAVGALRISTENGDSFCSATAITPRWLLTAAHCVDPSVIGSSPGFSFVVGDDIAAPAAVEHAIDDAVVHPNFNANDLAAGCDIALLHVAGGDLPLLPFKLNGTALTNAFVNRHVVVAGYGVTSASDGGGTTLGTRRSGIVAIDYVDNAIIASSQSTPSTCQGDSGGPAFVFDADGFPEIVGVSSFGDGNCDSLQAFSRVDAVRTFIDAVTDDSARYGGESGEGVFRNGFEPAL
jgi:secreted trypsin-like serine protease